MYAWYEEGSEVPPFKLGPPQSFRAPRSPFQLLNNTYDPLKQSQWWSAFELVQPYKQTKITMQVKKKRFQDISRIKCV